MSFEQMFEDEMKKQQTNHKAKAEALLEKHLPEIVAVKLRKIEVVKLPQLDIQMLTEVNRLLRPKNLIAETVSCLQETYTKITIYQEIPTTWNKD